MNIGKHNSIKSRALRANSNVYFVGCPCHLAHNTAFASSHRFSVTTGFDIKDLSVDLFYWFDKSTKRKGTLQEYCVFCDVTYAAVVNMFLQGGSVLHRRWNVP